MGMGWLDGSPFSGGLGSVKLDGRSVGELERQCRGRVRLLLYTWLQMHLMPPPPLALSLFSPSFSTSAVSDEIDCLIAYHPCQFSIRGVSSNSQLPLASQSNLEGLKQE